jgi:hypothetical protein
MSARSRAHPWFYRPKRGAMDRPRARLIWNAIARSAGENMGQAIIPAWLADELHEAGFVGENKLALLDAFAWGQGPSYGRLLPFTGSRDPLEGAEYIAHMRLSWGDPEPLVSDEARLSAGEGGSFSNRPAPIREPDE